MGWTIIPKGSLAEWGLKILMVLTPAFATGAYSYYSSKSEANAGYKTLVTRAEELEKTQDSLVKEVAYLRGELDGLRSRRPMSVGAPKPDPMPTEAPTPTVSTPRKPMPRNLDDAVQQKMF